MESSSGAGDSTKTQPAGPAGRSSDATAMRLAGLEAISDGVIIVDPARRFVVTNRKAREIWRAPGPEGRWSEGSALLRHALGQVADPKRLLAVVDELHRQPEREETLDVRLRDGRVLECYTAPYRLGDRSAGRIWCFRERRADVPAPGPLRDAADRLAEIEELGQIGTWEWIAASRTLIWSEQMYRIHGVDPATFAVDERTASALVHPDDRGPLVAELRSALRTGDAFERRFRIVRPDGPVRVVELRATAVRDASGALVRILGTYQDVTERVEADEELRAVEERFRHVFERAPIGMALIDGATLAFVHANRALYRILGAEPGYLPGREVATVLPPDRRDADMAALRALARGETEQVQVEGRYRLCGEERSLRIDASVLGGADGSPRDVVIQVQDVTAEHRAREQLRHERLHDGLTGLPNRVLLEDRLAHALAADASATTALIFLSLDRFELVRRSMGDRAADEAIEAIARRIGRHLGRKHFLARVGEHDFALVCEEVDSEREAAGFAEEVLGLVSKPVAVGRWSSR